MSNEDIWTDAFNAYTYFWSRTQCWPCHRGQNMLNTSVYNSNCSSPYIHSMQGYVKKTWISKTFEIGLDQAPQHWILCPFGTVWDELNGWGAEVQNLK